MNKYKFVNRLYSAVIFLGVLLSGFQAISGGFEWSTKAHKADLSVGKNLKVSNPFRTTEYATVTYQTRVFLTYGKELLKDLDGVSGIPNLTVNYKLYFYNDNQLVKDSVSDVISLQAPAGIRSVNVYNKNYGSVRLIVTSISPSPLSTSAVPADVKLELSLSGTDVNDFTGTAPVLSYDNTNKKAWWQYIKGAETYQLEWVYVDSADNRASAIAANNSLAFTYKEPVRVSTAQESFPLDFTYPAGTVYMRIRGAGKFAGQSAATIKYSSWSAIISQSISSAFERKKTWQYVATYTEDGAYKKVMKYFDGSMRNRQVATNLSSENTTLVGETKYDYEGRPAINVLPVPIPGSSLSYRIALNQMGDGSKSAYDNAVGGTTLPTTSGASNYYSTSNTATAIMNTYIPDAEGFPYSQTEYTADNTGRVSRQSAPGKALALSDTGRHYSSNYYGTPGTSELQRLFGSNVGDASHYKKILTLDANRQASVTYQDQEGRTIVTAMVGSNLGTLERLDNNSGTAASIDVNLSSVIDYNNFTSTSASSILNVAPADYTFSYNATGVIYKPDSSLNCAKCTYKVRFTIVDPDGNRTYDSSATITSTGVVGSNCTAPDNQYNFNIKLAKQTFNKVGSYTVTKKLTLDSGSVDTFTQSMRLLAFTPADSVAYINSKLSLIDTSSCDITCEQRCTTKVRATYHLSPGDSGFTSYFNTCMATDCSGMIQAAMDSSVNNECASQKLQMLDQLSPGGIYSTTTWMGTNMSGITFLDSQGGSTSSPAPTSTTLTNADLFKPYWAEQLFTKHPEYCVYTKVCATDDGNKYKAGQAYDRTLALVSDWTAAGSRIYTSVLKSQDAFLTKLDQLGLHVSDSINIYFRESYKGIDINGNSNTNDTLSLKTYVNCSAIYGGTAPSAQQKWQLFRSLYSGIKLGAWAKYVKTNCPSGYVYTDDAVIKDPSNYPTTQAAAETALTNGMTSQCAGLCPENATVWLSTLMNVCDTVGMGKAAIDNIKSHLQQYCISTCGNDNPLGISFRGGAFSGNPDIIAVQTALAGRGCSVDTIAQIDTRVCTMTVVEPQLGLTPAVQELFNGVNMLVSAERNNLINDVCLTQANQVVTESGSSSSSMAEMQMMSSSMDFGSDTISPNRASLMEVTSFQSEESLTTGGNHNYQVVVPFNGLKNYFSQSYYVNDYIRIEHDNQVNDFNYNDSSHFLLVMKVSGNTTLFNSCGCYSITAHSTANCLTYYSRLSFYKLVGGVKKYIRKSRILSVANPAIDKTVTGWDGVYYDGINCDLTYTSGSSTLTEKYYIEISYIYNSAPVTDIRFICKATSQTVCVAKSLNACAPQINPVPTCPEVAATAKVIVPYKHSTFTRVNVLLNGNPLLTAPVTYTSQSGTLATLVAQLNALTKCDYTFSATDSTLKATAKAGKGNSVNGTYLLLGAYQATGNSFTGLSEAKVSGGTNLNECGCQDNTSFVRVDPDILRKQCIEGQKQNVIYQANNEWKQAVADYLSQSLAKHYNACMQTPFVDNFWYKSNANEYQYTLYYYDQAGSLVQTVPPAGVKRLDETNFQDGKIKIPVVEPAHTLLTKYKYNSIGQLIWQKTPDGGETYFWYDDKGQLRLSQNAKQYAASTAGANVYSYTKYDNQGRVIEVGEAEGLPMTLAYMLNSANKKVIRDSLNKATFPNINIGGYADRVTTYYDLPASYATKNLRGRVAVSRSNPGIINKEVATYYNYDAHGNVNSLYQVLPYVGLKEINYSYDLISGKVRQVTYSPGTADQFIHKYAYDADNRLKSVKTSEDGVIWQEDAHYFYYKHGPLARVEIGNDKVQGLDYSYTLQGWLKGVNSPNLTTSDGVTLDPGNDGNVWRDENRYTVQDAFAYVLGYYQNDYKPIGFTNITSALGVIGASTWYNDLTIGTGLYNGNITSMVQQIYPLNTALGSSNSYFGVRGNAYRYDQLNRITKAYSVPFSSPGNWWGTHTTAINSAAYDASYTYDPNGNIRNAALNGSTASLADSLGYKYYTGTNQLMRVTDNATDINVVTGQTGNNYTYDAIGNLIGDSQAQTSISWTANGKVNQVTTTKAGQPNLTFVYDAQGNRVLKISKTGSAAEVYTAYVRDAQGNVLGTYQMTAGALSNYTLETPVYGSSRIGVYRRTSGTYNATKSIFAVQKKDYELTNHLGNVLATVSDRRLGVDNNSDGIADFYKADLTSASDYYPYGNNLPGRNYVGAGGYRYGYNTQEKVDEIAPGHYTAEFWEYDSRIGRRWNLDPVPQIGISDYAVNRNNPIQLNDPEGDVAGGEKKPSEATSDGHTAATDNTSAQTKEVLVQSKPQAQNQTYVGPYRGTAATENTASYVTEALGQKLTGWKAQVPLISDLWNSSVDMRIQYASGSKTEAGFNFLGTSLRGSLTLLTFMEGGTFLNAQYRAATATPAVTPGSFSLLSWEGYPAGGIKPTGPFRLLEGTEYLTARNSANATNAAMRRANPELFRGLQIHEIHPVKFGGSPTALTNKIYLTPAQHARYTTFWNSIMRNAK